MSMNPLNDISAVYVAEVLKPQLGKSSPAPAPTAQKKPGADSGSAGDAATKRIRQAVYDIRYRARREDIPLPQAFSQYMSHTSMNAVEKNSVRDKLGMGPGGGSVKEEVSQKKYQVRVTPKKGFGNPYVRYATDSKIAQLRSNPQISSVEKTKYGTPYEGERESGEQTRDALQHKPEEKKAKKDYDKDGKVETSTQEWKGSRDRAIKAKMSESFSNWRSELSEVVSDDILAKKKKEINGKGVDNYSSKVVKVLPDVTEGVQLLESFELSEEYIVESVNTAAQYFYEQGLNEHGVEILTEELGLDEFVSFVFEINDEVISEARAGGARIEPVTAKGQKFKSGKPTGKSLERLRKLKAERKSAEEKASAEKPSGMKAALQRQSAIATAKKQQPKKKGVLDRVAGAVLKGIERHQKATSTASKLISQTAQTAAKAARVGAKGASEFGKGVASGATGTVTAAKKVKKALNAGYELEGNILDEKATSEQQQKLFGLALSVKRGETSRSEVSDAVLKIVDTMSEKKIRDYAKTKHSGIPRKVEEAIVDQPTSSDNQVRNTQDDTIRKQQLKKKEEFLRKQQMLDRQRLLAQRAGRLSVNAEYEPDGESIEELNRYAKETGKSFRSGKPTSSGGTLGGNDVNSQVMRSVYKSMGAGRMGAGGAIKPRGVKKQKGGPTPGPVQTPAQKVAKRRADAQRAQDNMSSRFD